MALAAAVALAGAACDDAPPGPEQVADRFMALTQAGGARARTAAWDLLTPDSQDALRDRSRALDAAAGREPDDARDGAALLAGLDLEVVAPPGGATLVSPPGDRATVRFSGGPGKLHLRRIEGQWRVDLWRSLVPTSTATAPRPAPRE